MAVVVMYSWVLHLARFKIVSRVEMYVASVRWGADELNHSGNVRFSKSDALVAWYHDGLAMVRLLSSSADVEIGRYSEFESCVFGGKDMT